MELEKASHLRLGEPAKRHAHPVVRCSPGYSVAIMAELEHPPFVDDL